MSVVIPTVSGEPFYNITVTLDGIVYGFVFYWNTREERWYLSIFDVEGNSLLESVKLLTMYPIAPYQKGYRNLFPGILIPLSSTNDQSPPGLHDFGEDRRVQLVYYSQDEIDSVEDITNSEE